MLIISGVTLIIAVLLAATIASRMFASADLSPVVRGFIGSATFGVLLSAVGGIGVTMLMLFLEQPEAGAVAGVEEGVAAAIAVGGFFAARLLRRRPAADGQAA